MVINMPNIIFITGGVVSSLGKGVTAGALGAMLQAHGYRVNLMKCDPYLNIDPGTMNPSQHGEVFVTTDGMEVDLDFGHYERFVDITLTRQQTITTGQVYSDVLHNERLGMYLGKTVQVIPHITDDIRRRIHQNALNHDILLVEIGGTVGDIESLPFLEAIRQMRLFLGLSNTLFLHVTLVPTLTLSGDVKTKPTQHSVKELRSIGIQPDLLLCRSALPLPEHVLEKISLFTNVPLGDVFSMADQRTIYNIPLVMHHEGMVDAVLRHFNLPIKSDVLLNDWQRVVQTLHNPQKTITIALIGKYTTDGTDAYRSILEAICHAGIQHHITVNIIYGDTTNWQPACLDHVQGVIMPGGFGVRGWEGMLSAIQTVWLRNLPFLGICYGFQAAVVACARYRCHLTEANSTECQTDTIHPVIWQTSGDQTMRLGAHAIHVQPNTLAHQIYGSAHITERHRHRYDVNPAYVEPLRASGVSIDGMSDHYLEMISLPDYAFFLGCQFHPEFQSTPRHGHPLFTAWLASCLQHAS
jgi:CTP synthase